MSKRSIAKRVLNDRSNKTSTYLLFNISQRCTAVDFGRERIKNELSLAETRAIVFGLSEIFGEESRTIWAQKTNLSRLKQIRNTFVFA